ncbi:MAG: hypothetical protein ABMA64_16250 [Myxococcota bacterium]
MFLFATAFAGVPPEIGTEPVEWLGWTTDDRWLVVRVRAPVHADGWLGGTVEELLAVSTFGAFTQQWVVSTERAAGPIPFALNGPSPIDLESAWRAVATLPTARGYEGWAAAHPLRPPEFGDPCGDARWFARPTEVGVERDGVEWALGRVGPDQVVDWVWSADCAWVAWASHRRGEAGIGAISTAPAGPRVAVVGPPQGVAALLPALASLGYGADEAVPFTPAVARGATPIVYSTERARRSAERIAASLPGAVVAPLTVATDYDVLIAL